MYQPLNPEKQYRFRYIGNKPKDFINGLAQLRKAYEDSRTAQLKRQEEDDKPKDIEKIEEAIICSGDRDSLNVAGFGYYPLWLNSETAALSEGQYKEIMACVKNVDISFRILIPRDSCVIAFGNEVFGYSFYLAPGFAGNL